MCDSRTEHDGRLFTLRILSRRGDPQGSAGRPSDRRSEKAVREHLANGSDLMNICIDHRRRGRSNPDLLVAQPTFSLDEVKVIVEEAAKLDAKVAAHVYTSKAAQTAIQGGIASLEHGIYLDVQDYG